MKLERETRMTIGVLVRQGQSGRAIARILGVDESTVRYHLARQQSKAIDSPGHLESGCSPVQMDSKPSFSAVWASSTMRAQARPGSQPSNSLK